MATAVPNAVLQRTVALYIKHKGNSAKIAAELGLSRNATRNRIALARQRRLLLETFPDARTKAQEFEVQKLPDPDLPINDLIAHRIKQYHQKRSYEEARRIIPVRVKVKGPIGIWHFGDPHLDDDGTDLELIQHHIRLIKETPGLFGANVGDTSNNWVGRLSHLWSQQSTTARQMWQLVDWFVHSVAWIYIIGGNHDGWSGEGDPIKWMMNGQTTPYAPSEVRLELQFPNGNTCRINAHHDFSGHSQWNPAHGPMKANMLGTRDHIAIAGHKHISAHGVLKNPENLGVCKAFLVAGYKVYDRYAMEKGFRDQRLSPGVCTIIDPSLPNTHPDFVSHFWDLERGVQYLNYLRSR